MHELEKAKDELKETFKKAIRLAGITTEKEVDRLADELMNLEVEFVESLPKKQEAEEKIKRGELTEQELKEQIGKQVERFNLLLEQRKPEIFRKVFDC